jgi:hypothetical protein
MTNEQILEQQVEALEKLLQLRAAIIEELEAKVDRLEADKINIAPSYPGVNLPWITTPYVQPYNPGFGGSSGTIIISSNCPDGTPHQYPQTWSGTCVPCVKCGQSMGTISGITTQAGGGSNIAFTNVPPAGSAHTTGYITPVTSQSVTADGITHTVTHDNVFTLTNTAK